MTEEKGIIEEKPKRSPWGQLGIWVGVLLLLGIVAIQLNKAQEGGIQLGEKAPDFVLTTFEGEDINSKDLIGKVVLLNFWASWCKPCEVEAADLQTAWEMYKPGGEVVFLGVDYIDTDNEAMAYLEKFKITYPNGHDLGTRISQAFRITGVPETFIIDREGTLAYVKIGPFTSLSEITSAIDPLLGP
jgi:cytochrome c biogenesis protein CcmG/thiol:disulfide interchange protein DsbE